MLRIELLVAVPFKWPAFQRAAYDPRRDWLRRFADDPQRHWQDGYAGDVARPLDRLVQAARAAGVRVVPDATLTDMASATQRAEVVILVAHWKDHAVRAADLAVQDLHAAAQRLSVYPAFAELARRVQRAKSAADAVAQLQAYVMQNTDTEEDKAGFIVRAHPGTHAARRRDRIDALLAGLLRPGNRLELTDGLFDVHAVERAIAPGFAGVLDLTSCQARCLADHIDRRRLGECGVVQFEGEVMPEVAALAIERTLELCRQDAGSYMPARARALQELSRALQREVRRTPWERFWARVHQAALCLRRR